MVLPAIQTRPSYLKWRSSETESHELSIILGFAVPVLDASFLLCWVSAVFG